MTALVPERASRDSIEVGDITLLRNAEVAYPAWLEAISGAKEEVLFEMYWFSSDKTGWRFAQALMERAKAGVDVRVLYDSVGSLGSDDAMFEALMAAGAKVIEYHPLAPWRRRFRLSMVSRRDHRKIVIVDGAVAFTGGINITDLHVPREDGGGGWRDDAARVTGWAADELRRLFYDTWLKEGGEPPRRGGLVAARDRLALIGLARAQARKHMGMQSERSPIQVIGHAAFGAHRTMRALYLWHIRSARERIFITNAYFVPDPGVRRGLEKAAKRGVEVRVIVPARSDVPSVGFASSAMYARLLKAGVHIHLWMDGMIHAKTAVIDAWGTVGSYNLDYRSLLYNLEVNVASSAMGLVSALHDNFRDDLTHCQELDLASWKKRPFVYKLLEWIFYRLRKLL